MPTMFTPNNQSTNNARRSVFKDQLWDATQKYVKVMSEHTPHSAEELTNMEHSAERMAKALADIVTPKDVMLTNLCSILGAHFPMADVPNSNEYMLLTQGDIRSNSLCPHHFLPVQYNVFIAVLIPDNTDDGSGNKFAVFGLSKYTRAVQEIARRPVLQEQYARDIVNILTKSYIGNGDVTLPTEKVPGCLVVVDGQHGCMSCRGIKSDTTTVTIYSNGFSAEQRKEALALYQATK